ncbi:MAG: hypothetical protein D6732_27465 [Methanobacteriota archaeon]|nr:MAG: hypothetical protein D6732_27465 [Euryarchaeota archaeon]
MIHVIRVLFISSFFATKCQNLRKKKLRARSPQMDEPRDVICFYNTPKNWFLIAFTTAVLSYASGLFIDKAAGDISYQEMLIIASVNWILLTAFAYTSHIKMIEVSGKQIIIHYSCRIKTLSLENLKVEEKSMFDRTGTTNCYLYFTDGRNSIMILSKELSSYGKLREFLFKKGYLHTQEEV